MGEAEQWIQGLNKGVGNKSTLIVLGPEEFPADVMGAMGGFPALRFALTQYPNAAAIITTLPVGAFERPTFPKTHPPIYALGWDYLPDSLFLFKRKHLVGGVFAQPDFDPRRDMDPSLSPDERFDRNYVLATPANLRKLIGQY